MKAERLAGLPVGGSGASGGDAITGGSPTGGTVAGTSRSAAFHLASHSLRPARPTVPPLSRRVTPTTSSSPAKGRQPQLMKSETAQVRK